MSSPLPDSLARRYPLVAENLLLGGRNWTITVVQDQDALIRGVQTDAELAAFPYGMMLWASAIGLAERLAETPSLVRGKRVLEMGAGVGLAGLIAQSLGAQVTQTDYLPDILALCRHNAAQNGITGIDCRTGDWRDWPAELANFDVVLGADILYERTLHETLHALLPRVIAHDGLLLISDPLRPQAIDFAEQWEKEGAWRVTMEGRRVRMGSEEKDIGLFFLQRP